LKELLTEYEGIFAGDDEDSGRTNNVYHRIDTGDARPIRQPPRRIPLGKQVEVRDLLGDIQPHGVIEESDSPWSSPVVQVRNKNGELRFCVDYRKLNDVTKKDSFPLPRIDDTLDTVAGTKLFSILDLMSLYTRTTRRKQRFRQVKGYGSSQSCPLGSATLWRRLRG
jgi:hypothetical protein